MNNQLAKQANNLQEANSQFGTNSVIQASEMTREMAEVQARVVMAKQFNRSIVDVERKLQASCERKSLAEIAEYEFPRGNTKVVGPSIKLLEVVAQCYGNIQSGYDVLYRDEENHTSLCKAFAWDLENNIYTEIKFNVPHTREKKSGNEILTNPRDIYELEANQASRRVRKCLENVIPRDLVEQAREWCNETINSKTDVQGTITRGIEALRQNYGISVERIEKYFGMKRQAFSKNQMSQLVKIYNALKDGLTTPNEVFPMEEPVAQSVQEQSLVENVKKEAPKPEKEVEKDNVFDGEF